MIYENNLPKIETIQELREEYKIPTFEEFMRDYKNDNLNYDDLNSWNIGVPKGYGPTTDKDKKGKKCSGGLKYNEQHLIHTGNNKLWGEGGWAHFDEHLEKCSGGWKKGSFTGSIGGSIGAGGAISDGELNASVFKYSDNTGDIRVGNGSFGYEIGVGSGGSTIGYTARADLIDARTNSGVRANFGLDGSSNFTAGPGGVEVKAAGFGVAVGKKMGFSTPVGGFSVDLEEACVVQ